MKDITIVIPVKNEERNLPVCLENVKPFEHVVAVAFLRVLSCQVRFPRRQAGVCVCRWEDAVFPQHTPQTNEHAVAVAG